MQMYTNHSSYIIPINFAYCYFCKTLEHNYAVACFRMLVKPVSCVAYDPARAVMSNKTAVDDTPIPNGRVL